MLTGRLYALGLAASAFVCASVAEVGQALAGPHEQSSTYQPRGYHGTSTSCRGNNYIEINEPRILPFFYKQNVGIILYIRISLIQNLIDPNTFGGPFNDIHGSLIRNYKVLLCNPLI